MEEDRNYDYQSQSPGVVVEEQTFETYSGYVDFDEQVEQSSNVEQY